MRPFCKAVHLFFDIKILDVFGVDALELVERFFSVSVFFVGQAQCIAEEQHILAHDSSSGGAVL